MKCLKLTQLSNNVLAILDSTNRPFKVAERSTRRLGTTELKILKLLSCGILAVCLLPTGGAWAKLTPDSFKALPENGDLQVAITTPAVQSAVGDQITNGSVSDKAPTLPTPGALPLLATALIGLATVVRRRSR
jgi:hypothetical protein